uniref:DNA 3'-5' helicase n=1 Tax=MW polyomavirus TaxID=1203539 RepID=A0A159B681_9POLY|nr:large T antigen [MW polyomavirus]
MDRVLSRDEVKELMALLSLNVAAWGNIPLMQYKYRQACLKLHPDKGGDGEKMKRLNELFSKMYTTIEKLRREGEVYFPAKGNPTYGTPEWDQWWEEFNRGWDEDLSCNESFAPSDEEEPGPSQSASQTANDTNTPKKRPRESSSNSTCTPPKRPRNFNPVDFPEVLLEFLSNAIFSNKTLNSFVLYTTREKGQFLYEKVPLKFKAMFYSLHEFDGDSLLFLLLSGKHRVSAIKNYCSNLCTVSFLLVKGCLKAYECYYALCKTPFKLIKQSQEHGLSKTDFCEEEKDKVVNWQQICEFAVEVQCEDPLLLMGMLLDFAKDVEGCSKCEQKKLKHHYKFHEAQNVNSKLFKDCKNQKTICQQATDWVTAQRRLLILESTREHLLVLRFKHMFEKMEDICGEVEICQYMAGVAWLSLLMPHFDDIILFIIKAMTENVPKRRYVLFKGPINSGKTTVAAAILDLLGGKTLNVNCPPDKLAFEIGCAIDEYMVVFEDVKGQNEGSNSSLTPGMGMCNLDNLRDHLDGCVKVNLEKKHVNKKSQIFPPGIITMNDYFIPPTLQARMIKTINFRPKLFLRNSLEKNSELLRKRIVQSGVTLLLLLCWWQPVIAFHPEIHDNVRYWKETIEKYVPFGMYHDIRRNIESGEDPLKDILICVDADEDTQQDSGINSQ